MVLGGSWWFLLVPIGSWCVLLGHGGSCLFLLVVWCFLVVLVGSWCVLLVHGVSCLFLSVFRCFLFLRVVGFFFVVLGSS